MPKKLLNDEIIRDLKEAFKQLAGDVHVSVFSSNDKKAPTAQYAEITEGLIREFAEVDPRIKPSFHALESDTAKQYNVTTSPTILIAPEKYKIRFMGAPLGEEGRTFVMSVLMASRGASSLSKDSRARIKELSEPREIKVFVSPT